MTIIPFIKKEFLVLTLPISTKESEIFSMIDVVAPSKQGNIRHGMFTRDYMAPYDP